MGETTTPRPCLPLARILTGIESAHSPMRLYNPLLPVASICKAFNCGGLYGYGNLESMLPETLPPFVVRYALGKILRIRHIQMPELFLGIFTTPPSQAAGQSFQSLGSPTDPEVQQADVGFARVLLCTLETSFCLASLCEIHYIPMDGFVKSD